MSEWKEYKVSEIINEISMGPFGSNIKRDCYVDAGVPYLNGSNLCSVKLNEDVFNFVTEEKAKSLGRCVAKRGDIIVTHRGTIGQISYIPFDSKYELYLTGNSQFRLTVNSDMVRPDFLVYFFHTRIGQYRLLSNASQVGVPALARPTSSFKELQVPVPPMEIQNEVMAILHSLDDKIAVNKKICENLEAQAQALFKNWFVDFAPFKNGKFVESELGMIPEGWRVGTLGETGIVVCGKTPSKTNKDYYGGDIPFVKIPDMHNNIFVLKTEDSLSNIGSDSQPQKLIPAYSIMVSCIATIGLVSINIRPSHTNQQINSIIPKDSSYLFYLYEILNNMKKHLQYMGRGGTTLLNVNTKSFSNIKIIIPSNDSLFRFHEIISGIFSRIEVNAKENLRLASLRDTLLPKLMSGEIKI